MPELPEVETIRRQLAPLVQGQVLERVEVLDARWCAPVSVEAMQEALRGREVLRLDRRGKYLIWELDDGLRLLLHLRMTGALLADPGERPAHARVRWGLRAHEVWLVDPRRFGTGELARGPEGLDAFLATRLGLEPFDPAFTAAHLRALATGRRAPIKAFLLDQRRVAGIGNIYADEALHRAAIHPLRPAGELRAGDWERLRAAVLQALGDGIDARGASIDDFRHIDGVRGSFQERFLVYGRTGLPCGRCGAAIVKLRAAGRGTYICGRCQRAPRRRRPAAASGPPEDHV
ncbi:MAG TPA: bifunctional DNA-formamidopyrimidine glycosylase/DNA-(apurinic or apyrimidinic site) lyase [Solirubrobacteraceae bacterium]|jgi:formamidopyrimidine-DNA glycosylase|nr:bifunctional DNA-formamidopyrimidine glycosylase/DNA-(apurinic or apyrimidinic site) lyase [Solirubrobacteraceae bacterium]